MMNERFAATSYNARKNKIKAGLSIMTAVLLSQAAQAQVPDTLAALRTTGGDTRLSLHVNGGFYLGGTYDGTQGKIVAEGAGSRVLWYPEQAAFRAGYIDGTQWDDANIGSYSVALGYNVRASATGAVALGNYVVAAQQSSFAVGENCTASGAASVAMGYHAHTNARQGSFVFSDRSSVDTLRAGVNHSANWRVSGGFRIFTASNLSTGVTLQSGASVSNWGQASAVISTSTGAMLTTGGVWQNASDSNRKHNFETVSGEEILNRLRMIHIQSWSYKNEDEKVRHLGPTSQAFRAAFGLGSDERSIGTLDADGVALAGVQALDTRTRSQDATLKSLKEENQLLRTRLEALEKAQHPVNAATIPPIIFALLAGGGLIALLRRRRATESSKA